MPRRSGPQPRAPNAEGVKQNTSIPWALPCLFLRAKSRFKRDTPWFEWRPCNRAFFVRNLLSVRRIPSNGARSTESWPRWDFPISLYFLLDRLKCVNVTLGNQQRSNNNNNNNKQQSTVHVTVCSSIHLCAHERLLWPPFNGVCLTKSRPQLDLFFVTSSANDFTGLML